MSREQAYLHILDANSKIQSNVAIILEAKAVEAEKVRNWILNHVHQGSFETHEKQLSEPLSVHEQLVEVVEGLTKLQNGLCSNLKSLIVSDDDSSGGDGDFGGMFSGSFDMEDNDS
ncbi:hypothetical protein D3C76_170910 [compost metagenome]